VVIGITIGSGIFRTPAVIATRVPDASGILAVWVLGGVITLCGALSIAELAAALPRTGGLYVYLREGFGRLPAFLFGWAELVLIRASALGGMATVFSEYLLRSLGADPAAHVGVADAVAVGAIVVTAAVNVTGVRLSALTTGVSTITKFSALVLIVVASFALGGGTAPSPGAAGGAVDAGLFGLALISVLWAYDGFADIGFVGGEVANPQRNLPRAIIGGAVAVMAVYVATNAAYLYVMTPAEMSGSPLIAADTMRTLFGAMGVAAVSVVVTISVFGALNGVTLAAPRLFFAMAADGLFFRPVARVHPRYQTPYVAILMAAALGIAFVLGLGFERLADTFVLSIWPFYAVAVAAVYRLRATRPDMPRPYRVIGYPVVPAIFIAAAVYLLVNAFVTDTLWTSVTFGILVTGVPVYYLTFSRRPAPRDP
jgi:amino acid transporter